MRLKVVSNLQLFPKNFMIVDFAIDRQRQGAIIVFQRLRAGVYESLVWLPETLENTCQHQQYSVSHALGLANRLDIYDRIVVDHLLSTSIICDVIAT